jgi:proline dehydrogenase
MKDVDLPAFPRQWQPLVDRAANGLRELALNEEAKSRFCTDPQLRPFMHRVARRYVAGQVMISMEGSDRTDNIYATYGRLHSVAGRTNVGITVPVKLHRTASDLPRLMAYPGRIRLIKGAFLEPEQVAYSRNSPELAASYRRFATHLLTSGHLCSIATHDRSIQEDLASLITQRGIDPRHYEFESLIGLGTDQIDALRRRGFPTREYAVFGEEYFLYVLNRIAEEPIRLFQALIDVVGADN